MPSPVGTPSPRLNLLLPKKCRFLLEPGQAWGATCGLVVGGSRKLKYDTVAHGREALSLISEWSSEWLPSMGGAGSAVWHQVCVEHNEDLGEARLLCPPAGWALWLALESGGLPALMVRGVPGKAPLRIFRTLSLETMSHRRRSSLAPRAEGWHSEERAEVLKKATGPPGKNRDEGAQP